MAGEWITRRLGQVAEINPDAISADWPYSHICYIDISSVGEGYIEVLPRWMKLSDAPSRAKRLVCKGDVVLSTVRPNRRSIFFASQPGDDWVVSTGFAILRARTDLIEPRFLYACVFHHSFTEYLISREKGAAYPAVAVEDIANAEISLPPLSEQRAIAHILGTLDDKIELNRRMNRTLEATARAIFKSWFVDFDPVHAKAEGREPVGMDPETAALFPNSFQDSPLGKIPKGWEIVPFADTVEINGGGTPKTSVAEYWSGSILWFSVVDAATAADVFVIETAKTITVAGLQESSARLLPQHTTIITARGTVGRTALTGVPMAMNQSCYGLRGVRDAYGYYTYYSTRRIVALLQQMAHGSVFDTITRKTLASVMVPFPEERVIQAFERAVAAPLSKILANLTEASSLRTCRDLLLPRLLSGDLDVGGDL